MIPTKVQTTFDNIEKERKALLENLKKYSHESLNTSPTNGGWSALQVIHHLMLSEHGSLKYIKKKLSFNPALKKVSLKDHLRFLAFRLFFTTPIKIKAPKVVAENLPEEADLEETSKEWEAIRAEVIAFYTTVEDDLWDKSIFKHPFAGRISLYQTLIFFQKHFERHRDQIERTLKEVG